MTNTEQYKITSPESRTLEQSCNELISRILTEYSNTAYMKITGQNNLDFVPNDICDLWYSSEHPSISSIKRPTTNTDLVQLHDELIWLNDRLIDAFSNLF